MLPVCRQAHNPGKTKPKQTNKQKNPPQMTAGKAGRQSGLLHPWQRPHGDSVQASLFGGACFFPGLRQDTPAVSPDLAAAQRSWGKDGSKRGNPSLGRAPAGREERSPEPLEKLWRPVAFALLLVAGGSAGAERLLRHSIDNRKARETKRRK